MGTLKYRKKVHYGAILIQDFDCFFCIFFCMQPRNSSVLFLKQKIHYGAVLIQDFDFLVCVCSPAGFLRGTAGHLHDLALHRFSATDFSHPCCDQGKHCQTMELCRWGLES